MMRVISFKSVPVLFEMMRDGVKPFDVRKVDPEDPRFKALRLTPSGLGICGRVLFRDLMPEARFIEIVNTQTGEKFTRRIIGVVPIEGVKDWIAIVWQHSI